MRVITIETDSARTCSVPICACIGYFDGMHLGHQALITKTNELAEKYGCESALITFDPDPWTAIRGCTDVKHISTFRQRINKAVEFGIQNIVILKFTKKMSELSPESFISGILGRLNLKALVCGFDFHYGYRGEGNAESLRQTVPYEVSVIDAVNDSCGKISSTRISEAVVKGSVEEASAMLGYLYEMEGLVIHGRRKGTGMGFPTANIRYADEYLLPKIGVYACYACIGRNTYRAMVNIGHNPTLNYSEKVSLEAHIIGWSGDLYGKNIVLKFITYVRGEKQFKNRDNLIMQLEQDLRDINRIIDDYEKRISDNDAGSAER